MHSSARTVSSTPPSPLFDENRLKLISSVLVFPEGPDTIVGQELAGDYYEKAVPVIELQVAKAGYRLAAWLDLIAEKASGTSQLDDEL